MYLSMKKEQAVILFEFEKFMEEIEYKVLLDWKGQNEFIDWIRIRSREVLNK